MKAETKKDIVAFGRMVLGVVLMLSWWVGMLVAITILASDMEVSDAGWMLTGEDRASCFIVLQGLLVLATIPGSYWVSLVGGRHLAVIGLVMTAISWTAVVYSIRIWLIDLLAVESFPWRFYFLTGVVIALPAEVIMAFYFAWRRFAALRR